MKLFEALTLDSLSTVLEYYNPHYQNLRESVELTESVNFGAMQKVIYAYVFKTMKGLPSDAKHEADNDTFWVNEFDNAHKDLENDDVSSALDSIAQAICAVSEKIVDWYSDKMNHPPGYKPVKLKTIEDVSEKDVMSMLNSIDAKMVERELAAQKADAEKHKAVQAKNKEDASSKLSEIAAVIKKHDNAGWTKFMNTIKVATKQTVKRYISDYMPSGTTEEEFFAIKTAAQLKEFFKSAKASVYVSTVADNIENLDRIPSEERYLIGLAYVVCRDARLSKKLVTLL